MKVKNKKTGLESTITAEDWAKMQKNGLARKFSILDGTDTQEAQQPEEVTGVSYKALFDLGNKAFKEGNLEEAKKQFLAAQLINNTNPVKKKLEAVEEALLAKAIEAEAAEKEDTELL